MEENVSDLLEIAERVYYDATAQCIADVTALRDLETIRSRVKDEGLSFLTITLPRFCSDFEKSLQNGYIDSTDFRNFKKSGLIPAFLQGITSQIFDRVSGRILYESFSNENDAGRVSQLVGSVRQICLTFKKVELSCTPEREQAALASFVEIEFSFSEFSLHDAARKKFLDVSHVLWDPIVSSIELSLVFPHHGPGATAERISGNQKFVWRNWHGRLEHYFPFLGMAYPLGTPSYSKEFEMLTIIPENEEQPVKVTPVPKTLKGPRVIAIEPCCMQYAQQAIRDALYDSIESSRNTAGHVNFRAQSINQGLALTSSRTGQLATIDLSDASDRVPHDLAMEMFSSHPDLQGAVNACRSTRAQMPDGSVIGPLRKFASMGSALCFPVEAMYFYTCCVVALLEEHNLPANPENCFNVSRDLYVYGDDIIVPTTNAVTVLDHLRKYNCKVNINKTFCRGSFRESCGVDAYAGYEVTPTYLRRMRPENRRQPDRLISWVETSNLFYKKGFWRTASYLRNCVDKILGPLPYVSEDSPGLGYISYLGYRSFERWNEKYQRLEVRTWVPRPIYRTDKLEDYSALAKSLSALEVTDVESVIPLGLDCSRLERFALHGAVALSRRWVPTS